MTLPLLDVQLRHDAWATRTVLDACRPLTAEQFAAPFEIGPGSLMRTLAHIVDAMFFYADCFRGRPYVMRTEFETGRFTVDDLVEWLDQADAELRTAIDAFLAEHGPDTPVTWSFADIGRVEPAVGLAQALEHGAHHRAQCINMLRHLGIPDVECHTLKWAGADLPEAP